jgi:hypothetical protein
MQNVFLGVADAGFRVDEEILADAADVAVGVEVAG